MGQVLQSVLESSHELVGLRQQHLHAVWGHHVPRSPLRVLPLCPSAGHADDGVVLQVRGSVQRWVEGGALDLVGGGATPWPVRPASNEGDRSMTGHGHLASCGSLEVVSHEAE